MSFSVLEHWWPIKAIGAYNLFMIRQDCFLSQFFNLIRHNVTFLTFPHHLHRLGLQPFVLVGVVEAAEEEAVESHLGEQTRLEGRNRSSLSLGS